MTEECFPFFVINENILSKAEAKKLIYNYNSSKEDDYKIQVGNLVFFNEIKRDLQ